MNYNKNLLRKHIHTKKLVSKKGLKSQRGMNILPTRHVIPEKGLQGIERGEGYVSCSETWLQQLASGRGRGFVAAVVAP